VTVDPDLHVAGLEHRLAELERGRDAVEHATVSFQLGVALSEHPRADTQVLHRAIQHLASSLEVFDSGRFPLQRARVLVALGSIERTLGMSKVAVDRFRSAVSLLDGIDAPGDSGAGLNNLALALAESGQLEEAEAAYRRALDSFSDRYPRQRASTLYNLARVHLQAGDHPEAVTALREAQSVASVERDGPLWAMIAHELGTALMTSGREETAAWQEASEHLASAATVFTRRRYPMQFAMTRNNYGLARAGMPGAGPPDLRAALVAFEDALATLDVRLGASARSEAMASMNEVLRRLDEFGLGIDRAVHFAHHLEDLDPDARRRTLRLRLERIFDTPEPARSRLLAALDRGLCGLSGAGLASVVHDWLRILTEDRLDSAALAFTIRVDLLESLRIEQKSAVTLAMEDAIGELEVLVRMRVREMLSERGYRRPDGR
jgi:tetratricopeptide (TPR) repeat protein